MTTYDVCVFGGGPAGATMALKLADFGLSVLIVEKNAAPLPNIGLSLTTGIHHWLQLLDVADEVEKAGFYNATTSQILWSSKEPIIKNFTEEKAGYHVNRSAFDEILLEKAIDKGVALFRPCDSQHITETTSGNWQIELKKGQTTTKINTRFLVEASGRKSVIPGKTKAFLPHTLATYAYWENSRNTSFIEAGENGWYWGAPVPGLGYLACIFSDPAFIRQSDSLESFYTDQLKKATLMDPLKPGACLGKPQVCTATAYVHNDLVSKNYIRIGDAAFTMDPISSQGVQKAIKSAVQGAIVVNTLLAHKHEEIAKTFYTQMITREVETHTKWTRTFYAQQSTFPDSPFWRTRSHTEEPIEEVANDSTLTVRMTDKLIINPDMQIRTVPILGQSYIEQAEGLIEREGKEPLVFIENTQIVPLVRAIHGKTPAETARVIHSFLPASDPMQIMRWLMYHHVLSVQGA